MEEQFSNLNVGAPAFVPGQNIYASEFVPGSNSDSGTPQTDPMDVGDVVHKNGEVSQTDSVQCNQLASNAEFGDEPNEEDEDEEDWENEDVLGSEGGSTETAESDPSWQRAVAAPKRKPVIEKIDTGPRKEHVNLVFIGHVDAGKSTIGGHLLYLTGMVDQRTLEKYEREAKEKNRETWYLSWALDTNTEEREKGKTVEVGRAYFETEKKHFTVLDAPGHKSFVPNMIGGASQADLAILVISARRGEFETGFEKGGQTREHAMLVKTAGVKRLIVLINKMDDPTVEWDQTRYEECREKLLPYLRKCGFNPKQDVFFMPCSGLTGAWLKEIVPESTCSWYRGPTLIDYLDEMDPLSRLCDGPLRLSVADKYKDMGTVVIGKIESGKIMKGQLVTIMPNKLTVEVLQLWSDEVEVEEAEAGDNVKVKLKNVEEEDALVGFVVCSPDNLCCVTSIFDAQVVILEHKSIICAGYCAVLHLHCAIEEVRLKSLIMTKDRKTGQRKEVKPRFIKQDDHAVARFEVIGGNVCVETFKDFPQMGRFTLRDEGRTIAIGKVLKILPSGAAAAVTD